MTLKQLLKKYPHLAEMHIEESMDLDEIQEKQSCASGRKQNKKKKLLLD